MGWATVYDNTALSLDAGETAGQTLTLSICKSGANTTQVVAKSSTSVFTGVYECIWQQYGGGTNPIVGEYTVTDHEISFTTTWDTYPTSATQLRFVARRNNSGGGSDIFGGTATSAEITGECAGGGSCTDETVPTVSAVSVGSITYNSAVLTVTASDNIGVTGYIVKNGASQIASSATSPITITGLTAATTYDNIKVIAKDACNNESAEFAVTSFTTGVRSFCSFATGHLGQANFGDANGRILLTLTKLSASSVGVTVEPNNGGADVLDFVEVILGGVSHTLGAVGGSAPTNTEIVFDGLASLDFNINVLWHNHNWADAGGRWTTQSFAVTEAELCPGPIDSEYCKYEDSQTIKGGKNIALTWETDGSGNVIITMQPGTGTTSCSFRNGGFEGGIGAFVVSTDDFVNTTPASDYFTATQVYSGNTYTLTKIADLPANAKIKHVGSGHALAWVLDGNNEYTFPDFIYTYGGTCNQLDAPTNVSIDANNIITFDAVTGASSYTAIVSLSGVQKYSQVVASGDELTFTPLVDGDYDVTVVASGTGKTDSDPSTAFVWSLTAAPIVLGNSEYCEHLFGAGNQQAALTWETDGNGNIVITISDVIDGTNDPAHFRGNGMALGNFQVGAGKEAASNYFNHACGGSNQVTLSLKDPAIAPVPGEKIYFTDKVVEYTTKQNTNAYSNFTFEYTYGTVCAGKSVSATSNNSTMGTAVVKKGDDVVTSVDDGDEVSFIATVANAELYRFVNWTKGGVEVSTNATYTTTITETTNLIANFDYIRNTYCHAEVLSNASAVQGKKLYMTLGSIGGGKYQIKFEGSAEAPLTSLANANYTVNRVTTDIDNGQNMSGNDVPFPNARWSFDASGFGSASMEFGIQDGYTWEDIYVWNHNIYFMTAAGELGYTAFPDRYHIAWNETCADPTKPSMVSASKQEETATTVVIAVEATDDVAVTAYHVVDDGNGVDANFTPSAGKITISGLTESTAYTFTITAINFIGLESDNHVVVNATTVAQVTAPTTAAPTPPALADQWVRPVYSDAYTSILEHTFALQNWGSKAGSYQVVEGDNYILYDFSADGNTIVWGENNAGANAIVAVSGKNAGGTGDNTGIDASTMEKLHLDIWSNAASNNVEVRVNDQILNRVNLTGNGWQQFDLVLSEHVENVNLTSVRWMKFTNISGANRIAIDNVYFWREPVTGDDVKPVMGEASLESVAWNRAIINVAASDNVGVESYYVVELNAEFTPTAGQITVTGLSASTPYTLNIKAKDASGNVSDNSAEVSFTTLANAPATAAPVPTVPAAQVKSLYSDTYAFAPASLHSYNEGWWQAPTMTEGNIEGNHYLDYNLFQNGMIGVWFDNISVATMEKIHIDIWASAAGSLTFRPITGGSEIRQTLNLSAQQWNSFDLDMADFTGQDWANLYQYAFENYQAGGLVGEHICVDNVFFYRESPLADSEAPTNVTASAASSFYSVKITAQAEDNSGAVNFSVKNGEDVVATGAAASGTATTITVNNLTQGTAYNFNVIASDDAGNESAPVAVAANTLAEPAAAPVPTEDAANVMAVFSDAYTPVVTVGNYCEWWWESPAVHNVTLGSGDNARFYDNNHQAGASFGWSWDAANKIDFTGFQKLHLHIYPAASGTIEIYPVVAPEGEFHKVSQTLTAGQWNEVVLDYTANTLAPLNHIGFVNFFGLGDFFIDNVYFFAEAPEPEWETVRTGLDINRHYTVCLEKNVTDIDGATFWSLDKRNAAGTMAYLEEELTPEAGKPYIIQATKATLKVVYGNETAGAPVENGALRGTFVYMDADALAAAGSDVYMLFNNELRPIGSNNHLDAHRAYVLYNELQAVSADPVPAPGRRVKGMPLQRDAATGIDELNASEAPRKMMIDGQLFIIRGEKLYDATGRLVK